jgi:hypothetical protein
MTTTPELCAYCKKVLNPAESFTVDRGPDWLLLLLCRACFLAVSEPTA